MTNSFRKVKAEVVQPWRKKGLHRGTWLRLPSLSSDCVVSLGRLSLWQTYSEVIVL